MEHHAEIEQNCLDHLNVDYMPLHDIVREFSGFERSPTERDFLNTLEFLEYFIDKHNIKCLLGSDMKLVEKHSKELIDWLKECWYSGKYDEINYGVWFDKQS